MVSQILYGTCGTFLLEAGWHPQTITDQLLPLVIPHIYVNVCFDVLVRT